MSAYPIAAVTVAVYPGGFQESVTVKNSGSSVIYLSHLPKVTTNDYPLSPGSSLVWDARKPLFAACAAGQTSTLLVLENSGNLFDASAVASQILTQGLATQIADAITLNGVPPINPFDLLYSGSALGNQILVSGRLATANYASLDLTVSEKLPGAAPASPLPRDFTVSWYRNTDADSDGPLAVDYFHGISSEGTAYSDDGALVSLPVRGPFCYIVGSANARTTNTYQVRAVGSYRTIPKIQYSLSSGYHRIPAAPFVPIGEGLDRYVGFYAASVAAGTYVFYVPHIKGRSLASCTFNSPSTSTLLLRLGDFASSGGSVPWRAKQQVGTGAFQEIVFDADLPMRAQVLLVTVFGTNATEVTASLAFGE